MAQVNNPLYKSTILQIKHSANALSFLNVSRGVKAGYY